MLEVCFHWVIILSVKLCILWSQGGPWRTLKRNVLSFHRGVSNLVVQKRFENFLSARRRDTGRKVNVVVGSRVVSTAKLLNDFLFFQEVER